jgi:hypothetical protein
VAITEPLTVGDLAEYAARHPAGADMDSTRRQGRKAKYPRCCIEFYVALLPFISATELRWNPDPRLRAFAGSVESDWTLAGNARLGYVACPVCLALPMSTPPALEGDPRRCWPNGHPSPGQTFGAWLDEQEARRRSANAPRAAASQLSL